MNRIPSTSVRLHRIFGTLAGDKRLVRGEEALSVTEEVSHHV